MKFLRTLLVAAIVVELVALGLAWRRYAHQRQLPLLDWEACLIDPAVAAEIQGMENGLDPSSASQWAELGAAYRAFGLFPQAEYCYERIDKLAPADRGYLYFQAECLDLMGKTREASKIYNKIIDEKLTSPIGERTASYCWLNIGQDRLREEDVPAAIDALAKADDIPKAKFLMSRVLIRSGRVDEAVVLLDQLLAKSPGMVEFNQMKAWAEQALGNRDAAEDFYQRSMRSREELDKTDPTFAAVKKQRLSRGSAKDFFKSVELGDHGQFDEALRLDRLALRSFWTEDRADQEARLILRMGHPREAIGLAEECVRRVGGYATTLDIIGIASAQISDFDKARRVWLQAVDMVQVPGFYSKLATFAANVDDTRKYQALEVYLRGKEDWLKNGLTTNGLATARQEFEKSLQLFDAQPHAWFYLGDTCAAQGDTAAAEAAYRHCLQLNPDDGRAIRGLEHLKK